MSIRGRVQGSLSEFDSGFLVACASFGTLALDGPIRAEYLFATLVFVILMRVAWDAIQRHRAGDPVVDVDGETDSRGFW